MAPARMVSFIKSHVSQCGICQADPDIEDEINKITEIILPKSKIPKAVRLRQEAEEAEQIEDDLDDDDSEEIINDEEEDEDEDLSIDDDDI